MCKDLCVSHDVIPRAGVTASSAKEPHRIHGVGSGVLQMTRGHVVSHREKATNAKYATAHFGLACVSCLVRSEPQWTAAHFGVKYEQPGTKADMPQLPAGPYPGDDVIPDAVMIYDQTRLVHAPVGDVWPWILQVGKGRGGWYLPSSWEWLLPASWRASRTINPAWQQLKEGDRVDDYGFSVDDYFIVAQVLPRRALVYKSDRYGASFSWSLILHEFGQGDDRSTLVHLRFRGRIAATGLERSLLVWGGGVLDHLTTAPMLAGMAERAENTKSR